MRGRSRTPDRAQAFLALAAIVPAPTLGLVAALYVWPDRPLGQLAFALCKLWLVALPVVWLMLVEGGRPRIPLLRAAGMAAGVGTGVAIFAGILAAYALLGHWIDADAMARQIDAVGLGDPAIYLLGALYWCTVNSIIEEYVWRWFVFTRCETLLARNGAVIAAGACFTLHHVVALAYYFDWRVTLLGAIGVFVGGTTWSWLYLRWRNLYAAYVSHVFADLAIFGIGWHLAFGSRA
jgi:membrane protease YdiL (CAAX protease family)